MHRNFLRRCQSIKGRRYYSSLFCRVAKRTEYFQARQNASRPPVPAATPPQQLDIGYSHRRDGGVGFGRKRIVSEGWENEIDILPQFGITDKLRWLSTWHE